MKKLNLTMLTLTSAFCMMAGAFFMADVDVAKADNTVGATPTLSTTKVMVSKENDKMMLVTAIKDMADVYEVGYTFGGTVATTSAEKTKYYTSIGDGTTTLTADDVFEETWAADEGVGMIIWEVEFGFETAYEYKAYAKVGERNDEGELVLPSEEVVVTPVDAINKTFYQATFKIEEETVSTQIYTDPASVEVPEIPFKPGYVGAWDKVAGNANATINAVYTEVDYKNYPIYNVTVDVDMRDEAFNITLPEEVSGYQKVYAKLASFGDGTYETGATLNEDGTLNIPKASPNRGENLIRLFMYKDATYATVEIALTKADMILKTKEDLTDFAALMNAKQTGNKYFILGADIDYNGDKYYGGWPDAAGYDGTFAGTFDGRGYTISNLDTREGLFDTISGTVKNLILNSPVKGAAQGGALCHTNAGTIENCVVKTWVSAGESGVAFAGLAHTNNAAGIIKNCVVEIASYTAYDTVKQINAIAVANSGTVENCYAVTAHSDYMYGTTTDGLYKDSAKFFEAVTTLPSANGWSSYWKIENGGLYFNNVKVL